jgi:hypothetical protein
MLETFDVQSSFDIPLLLSINFREIQATKNDELNFFYLHTKRHRLILPKKAANTKSTYLLCI